MSRAEHLEVLVEEPSMEVALQELLPKLLDEAVTFQIYPSQCKDQMLKDLPQRLRGYARWLPANWRIVVVLDQDNRLCTELKESLEEMAARAGLMTKTRAAGRPYQVVHRIAVEELEAWFFGDPVALRAAYPRLPANFEKQASFRDPDAIQGGTWEALERLLQKVGYFQGGLRKLEVAREIGRRMDPGRNTSHSFQVFRDMLSQLRTESSVQD